MLRRLIAALVAARSRILPRLLLGFVALSPLPLAGLAWLYTQAFERALTDTVLKDLSSIADKKADQVNGFLDARVLDTVMLASSPATVRALQRLPGLLQGGAGAASDGYREEDARYRDHAGDLFGRGNYYDLFLIDLQGTVVFSVKHEPDFASNLNIGPYRDTGFAEAQRAALLLLDTRTTPAERYEPSGGRPAIFVVTPVIRENRVLGAVAMQLDLDPLIAVATDNTGLGESGETVLAQKDGAASVYVGPLRHVPDAAFRHRVGMAQLAQPMRNALAGMRGNGVARDYAGVAVVAAWRHLPALGWGMVVKEDAAEALEPAARMRRFSAGALVLLLMVSAVMATLFGRTLVKPIGQLTRATRRIADGDLTQRAPAGGSLEFRELADSFNRMADRLAQEQALLERRVDERTRELAQSRARYEDLAARIPVGVFVFRVAADASIAFNYVSPPFCDLLALSAADVLADPYRVFARLHPDELDVFFALDYRRAGGAQPVRWQGRVIVEGETRWMEVQATPTVDRDGGSVWNGTIADVTDRKQVEETVLRLNAELEQRVARRTAQFEAAMRELEELSYSMSHDMRTPLRAIHGYARIVLDEHGPQLDEEGRRLQQKVCDSAARMGRMIDDTVLFLGLGRRKLKIAPVDLAAMAAELFRQRKEAAGAAHARLDLGPMPPALGDRDMLRLVLGNLLSNAFKFAAPERDLVVEIGGRTEGGENIYHVRDNGVGFDMRYAGKLFKVFERVHSPGRYEGAALGLAIVKRIVERHGGRVRAEGEVGSGATFHFSLLQGGPPGPGTAR